MSEREGGEGRGGNPGAGDGKGSWRVAGRSGGGRAVVPGRCGGRRPLEPAAAGSAGPGGSLGS